MKTATKIALSLISSAVLVLAASWIYLGHFLGPKITEHNVGLVMWSAAGITAALIVTLTLVLYRVVR
jgi:membrane protein DedA with SNARE-associated domain